MIKAVIFDLDGTLVDSIKDIAISTNYALSKYGFPTHEFEKYNYFVGNGVPKLIERAIPKEKLNEQSFNNVHKTFSEHYGQNYLANTVPYEGVIESLNNLKKAGVRLAVLSNKKDEYTQKIVAELFGNIFDFVLGKSEEYPLKPNPESTFAAIKGFGVGREECAFLGDSGVDMETAVNSGCIPIGVTWGFRTEQELIESGAEYLIHNANNIANFLLGL